MDNELIKELSEELNRLKKSKKTPEVKGRIKELLHWSDRITEVGFEMDEMEQENKELKEELFEVESRFNIITSSPP